MKRALIALVVSLALATPAGAAERVTVKDARHAARAWARWVNEDRIYDQWDLRGCWKRTVQTARCRIRFTASDTVYDLGEHDGVHFEATVESSVFRIVIHPGKVKRRGYALQVGRLVARFYS